MPRAVVSVVADLMHRADFVATAEIVHDGLTNVLKAPEFSDPDLASRTLRMLEEQNLLGEFLSRARSVPRSGGCRSSSAAKAIGRICAIARS